MKPASMVLIRLMGWIGAAGIMAAPFVIETTGGQLLAAGSLFLLTIQLITVRAWNIVLANTVGIIGYLWSILA